MIMLSLLFFLRVQFQTGCDVADSHGRVPRDRSRVASAPKKGVRITNNKNANVPLNKS